MPKIGVDAGADILEVLHPLEKAQIAEFVKQFLPEIFENGKIYSEQDRVPLDEDTQFRLSERGLGRTRLLEAGLVVSGSKPTPASDKHREQGMSLYDAELQISPYAVQQTIATNGEYKSGLRPKSSFEKMITVIG